MFDIIVPVYNAMHHVRSCLFSLFRHSSLPFHAYVVNDASDRHTADALRELLASYASSQYTLIEHDHNLGYLRSVNGAIPRGNQPYVILLNSDVVVTPGYLERLRNDFEADPNIAIVNPVSTWANWTRIAFPEGYNILELTEEVARQGSGRLPDINNASGFFFAVRRSTYERLGLFDEAYGAGYWEEADFCMRVLTAGLRVVVDDGLYVFHHGWGSFMATGRNEQMEKNRAVFMKRWERPYRAIEQDWKANNPLERLQEEIASPDLWRRKDDGRRAAAPDTPIVAEMASERLKALRDYSGNGYALRESLALSPREPGEVRNARIVYILPAIALYGGVISVLQVVNQLVLRGYDANVATYGKVDEDVFRAFPIYFRPYVFGSEEELVAGLPGCDLIVTTSWETVYPAVLLRQLRPAANLAYFVQDFEPDFYLPEHPHLAAQAERTYALIDDKIVKTGWLERRLEDYEGRTRRIPLGLNLDFFYDQRRPRPLQILALARPSSVRRNFPMVCRVYAELHVRRPEIQLALYGPARDGDDLPFPVKEYGPLTSMSDVAAALNETLILLDCSTFQGFGRPGLEAMACGTAALLTHEGGITEYAKHEYNCLLIDPFDQDDIVSKVLTLVDDETRRTRLIRNALETARSYSLDREGERTAALFRSMGYLPAWEASGPSTI